MEKQKAGKRRSSKILSFLNKKCSLNQKKWRINKKIISSKAKGSKKQKWHIEMNVNSTYLSFKVIKHELTINGFSSTNCWKTKPHWLKPRARAREKDGVREINMLALTWLIRESTVVYTLYFTDAWGKTAETDWGWFINLPPGAWLFFPVSSTYQFVSDIWCDWKKHTCRNQN